MRQVTLLVLAVSSAAFTADWPMYRHDAARTASTPQQLPEQLHLQWVRALPPRQPAFAYDTRMCIDEGHFPVVAGGTVFVGLDATNSVVAIDAASGDIKWRFYAEGPVRFAPIAADGRVWFGADDGVLYCLTAADGKLLWKYDGAPADRKIINHGRLSSNWPVSVAPILHDGVIYFGNGVWPIDGTLAHAVDAATGKRLWTSPSHVNLGYGTIIGGQAIMPSGKYPNVFDLKTGAPQKASHLYEVKNLPTCVLAAWGDTHLFNGNKAYAVGGASVPREQPTYRTYANAEHEGAIWTPVIDRDRIYGVNDGILRFYRLPTADELAAAKKKDLIQVSGLWWINARPAYKWSADVGEELKLPPVTDIARHSVAETLPPRSGGPPKDWYPRRVEIKAGSRLYASGGQYVVAIDIADETKPRVTWLAKADSRVTNIIAAADRLFVTAASGRLYCFGASKTEPKTHYLPTPRASFHAYVAGDLLMLAPTLEGFCLVLGVKDGRVAEELVRHPRSALHVIALDPDEDKVNALRNKFDDAGLLGPRLEFHTGDSKSCDLPRLAASLITSEHEEPAWANEGDALAAKIRSCLRPYGGIACSTQLRGWPQIPPQKGPLDGADDWTHERHGVGATLVARDTAAKPPLGLLWYGGPAAEWHRTYSAFLPPGLEVVEGRYIMQGHGLLSCIDVYTGRLMWEARLPTVQYYGAYLDTLKDAAGKPIYPEPDSPVWQGDHAGLLPGEIELAKLSGNALNVVSMPDAIYVAAAEKLLVLDINSGKTEKAFAIPFKDLAAKRPLCWGAIRVVGDTLVATAFDPADIKAAFEAWRQGNEKNKQRMPMKWLFAANRKTGDLLWKRKAETSWLNWGMAIGGGKVFALDLAIPEVIAAYKANNWRTEWPQRMLYALDLKSGDEVWKHPVEFYFNELAYNAEKDLLIVPCRERAVWKDGDWKGAEAPKGRTPPSVLAAYQGKDGKLVWQVEDGGPYAEPLMLHPQGIVTRRGLAFDYATGKPAKALSILTGEPTDWQVSHGGCNFLIGSDYLATHRVCYQDLRYNYVVPLPGMRSGCSPSIVPANGVLSVFNYAANYPSDELRSAYVLVHRPENANWTRLGGRTGPSAEQVILAAGHPVKRLGLNLGAPADHVAPDGTPWLRVVPSASDAKVRAKARTPNALAAVSPAEVSAFSLHPASVKAGEKGLAWVAASGFVGISELVMTLPGAASYVVRLHFVEPDDVKPGQRVFSVAVQGKEALAGLDVAKEAGGSRRAVVREFKGIQVSDTLKVALTPAEKSLPPLLCGVEIIAE
ncbi:MAG: hypothetical protein FJ290_10305 [Planctomycetes bacterium]|nr:hypothetical protein [Planctomycetota bacterium]